MQVVDQLGARDLGLPASAEASVPLLPAPSFRVEADVDHDVPERALLAALVRANPLVDMALHQRAPSQSSRAGTGTRRRLPSLRVGSSPRRAAS